MTPADLTAAHSAADCQPPCCIHAPSDHPLAGAPLHWRHDRRIFERICAHGIGHPDPDDRARNGGDGIHGCDGCCRIELLDQEDQ